MSRHKELSAIDANVFLTCSAFEYGETDADANGACVADSGIVAFIYPPKKLENYRAKPFEKAVVRFTRSSLCVYRPSDQMFFCEFNWSDVRKKCCNTVVKRGEVLYEFAFFTEFCILVFEVMDAKTADGIVASLRLLDAGEITTAPKLQATTTTTTTTTAAAAAAAAAATHNRQSTLSMSSVRTNSPVIHTRRLKTSEPCAAALNCETLQRIRRRAEEMRRDIFYVPSHRLRGGSLGCVGSCKTCGRLPMSLSPAPRLESEEKKKKEEMQESVNNSAPLRPPPSPLQWSAEVTVAGAGHMSSQTETASEMRNFLKFLEEEEKKAICSLKSQEARVRALCFAEKTSPRPFGPRPPAVVGSSGCFLSCNGIFGNSAEQHNDAERNQIRPEVHKDQIFPDGSSCASFFSASAHNTHQPCEAEQQPLSAPAKLNSTCFSAPPQNATRTFDAVKKDGDIITAEMTVAEGEGDKNSAAEEMGLGKETEYVDFQHKADAQSQGQGVCCGLPLNARGSEKCDVWVPQNDINSNNQPPPVNNGEEEKKTGGAVLYGNWKELRQKETGKVYYRHIVSKQATWKPPPEVVEMKKQAAAGQAKQDELKQILSLKRGALRVLGAWKEYNDPNSGRLYYVNTETKQRTWKVEETPFVT